MFVEFMHCRDCIYKFKIYKYKLAVDHYNGRKNVKRCIGCENLQRFYKDQVKKVVEAKIKECDN